MITRSENRWIWGFILVILIITTVPYFLGFALQGSDFRFSGFFIGVEDGNSYIAKMLIGASGGWLFKTPYTAFPQSGFIAFIPYILLGKLTAPPAQHEQLLVLFQLFRWGGGMAMILATYQFISHFIKSIGLRKMGLVLACTGGGLGWLTVGGLDMLWSGRLPLEFYSPETFGFLSLLGLPHLSLGRALLLWGVIYYLEFGKIDRPGLWRTLIPGVLWFLLGFMQPLTIVTGWAILLSHLLAMGIQGMVEKWRSNSYDWQTWARFLRIAILTIIISSPWVIYNTVSFSQDTYLREWVQQNIILSPPISDYILAFALIIPFAILGIRSIARSVDTQSMLLLAWIGIFPILAYAPYNLQRRLPEGIWVALVVLGVMGYQTIKRPVDKIISKAWLFSGGLPALIIIAGSILTLTQLSRPVYLTFEEVKAMQFASEKIPAGSTILTDYDTSNALPAWIPARTLIGHGPESMHLFEVGRIIEELFNNQLSIEEQELLLDRFKVDLVLLTPRQSDFDKKGGEAAGVYQEIYRQDNYIILKVIK